MWVGANPSKGSMTSIGGVPCSECHRESLLTWRFCGQLVKSMMEGKAGFSDLDVLKAERGGRVLDVKVFRPVARRIVVD